MPTAPLSRRSFLGGSTAAVGSLATVSTLAVPAAGFFTADDGGVLRVGVVGCGGRGTGAAAQAAAADPGVRITVLADLFADQIDSAVETLRRTAGRAFECPRERRFVGADAWRLAIESEIDVVILATSPDVRPMQAAAAAAAGRHVFCEAPAAIDAAGVATVLEASAHAAARGRSFAAGLAWRHDPTTIRAIETIRSGAIGRPVAAVATSRIGLPWHRPVPAGQPLVAADHRNWITCTALSGGHLVEHMVHAIDKVLWAFGDEPPVRAEPRVADGRGGTGARYVFADGRVIEAGIARRSGERDRIEEWVRGTHGSRSLRAAGAGRHARGMNAFVRSILDGAPLNEGPTLCRSTLAAILGREAAAGGMAWADLDPAGGTRARPEAAASA